MSLPVRITPEAHAQILEIDNWWQRNRPSAPDLFVHELGESLEIIARAPQIGRLYRSSPVPRVPRLLLRGTRYHIYYVIVADEVRVLALWHAQRGAGPPVRMP